MTAGNMKNVPVRAKVDGNWRPACREDLFMGAPDTDSTYRMITRVRSDDPAAGR